MNKPFQQDFIRTADLRTSSVDSVVSLKTEVACLETDKRPMSNRHPHHHKSHLVVQSHHVGHGSRPSPHTPSHSNKNLRKSTFDSNFITPGTIVEEMSSRNHSAGSKMDRSPRGGSQMSDMRPRESMALRKSVSAEYDRAQEHEKQMEAQSGHMQLSQSAQSDKFKGAFLIFDRDGDGRITIAEMARVMQSLGYQPNEKEIAEMFHKADVNRNGTIEFDEFIQVLAEEFSEHNEATRRLSFDEDLHAVFEIFDLNKDGRITAQELNHAMLLLGEQLSPSELEDMMRTADTNGDGAIDFQEFQNLFRHGDQKLEAAMNKVARSAH